jgi:hypothetical protein
MPAKNPWLADSAYPISHATPAATEAVAHAGPTTGRRLSVSDVKTVPGVFTSNPTIKNVGGQRIVIASGVDGIRKILATGEKFELVSFIPYPGLDTLAVKADPKALDAALAATNAAMRTKDDAKLLALSKPMEELGFSRAQIPNGTYNFIDKDGFHYAPFGGLKVVKSTDDNDPRGKLRIAKSKDLAPLVPTDLKASVTHILGMAITYQGDVAVAAGGILFLLDRELELKGVLPFPGELVENDICVDEQGIYVVTSKRMLKVVWTGSKLSIDEADGGWASEYNTMSRRLRPGLSPYRAVRELRRHSWASATIRTSSSSFPTLIPQAQMWWRSGASAFPKALSSSRAQKAAELRDKSAPTFPRSRSNRPRQSSAMALRSSTVRIRSLCLTFGAMHSRQESAGRRPSAFKKSSGIRRQKYSRNPGSTTRSITATSWCPPSPPKAA